MVVNEESRHVVVLRRGQFCARLSGSDGMQQVAANATPRPTDWFDCLDGENRPCLTDRQILKNLEAIVTDADKTPVLSVSCQPRARRSPPLDQTLTLFPVTHTQVAQNAVGLLTTENRKIWSSLRAQLISSNKNNAKCLSVVDSALFIVCLDDAAPRDLAELCGNFLCGTYGMAGGIQVGTCTNRWYDKVCWLPGQNRGSLRVDAVPWRSSKSLSVQTAKRASTLNTRVWMGTPC